MEKYIEEVYIEKSEEEKSISNYSTEQQNHIKHMNMNKTTVNPLFVHVLIQCVGMAIENDEFVNRNYYNPILCLHKTTREYKSLKVYYCFFNH